MCRRDAREDRRVFQQRLERFIGQLVQLWARHDLTVEQPQLGCNRMGRARMVAREHDDRDARAL